MARIVDHDTEFQGCPMEFELENPDEVTWAGGQVRGPRRCAVVFPA